MMKTPTPNHGYTAPAPPAGAAARTSHARRHAVTGCVALVVSIALLACLAATASAHPQIAYGFNVDGEWSVDPSGPGSIPSGTPFNGGSPPGTGRQRGCIVYAFSGACKDPTVVNLSFCDWISGGSGCDVHFIAWDHNFNNPARLIASGLTEWVNFVSVSSCLTSSCSSIIDEAEDNQSTRLAPCRDSQTGGGNSCPMTWPALCPSCGAWANDFEITSNLSGTGSGTMSHRWFFLRAQTMDTWAHLANDFCTWVGYAWNHSEGDCNPGSAPWWSQEFWDIAGNCGPCPSGPGGSNQQDAQNGQGGGFWGGTAGGSGTQGDRPWRPDWGPWQSAVGGRFRNVTSPGGPPFRTVDPTPTLRANFTDVDGEQYPWEGYGTIPIVGGPGGPPGEGQGLLRFRLDRVSGGGGWICDTDGAGACNNDCQAEGTGGGGWLGSHDLRQDEWVNCTISDANALSPGAYRWRVTAQDHHGVWGARREWQYFTIISPGSRECDEFAFVALCDFEPSGPGGSPPNKLEIDDAGPGTTSGAPGTPGNSAAPLFTYTLLQNTAPTSTPLDTTTCVETTPSSGGPGGLSAVQRNQVMTVHVNLTRFLQKQGNESYGAISENSLRGAIDLRQRQSHDYLFALGCEQ